ncbi:DUF397 domain-containing protein [Nonomuraea glycinis]|uniref:DUF397 domain-containing protein n=1 Tax=Nonomuraea glycinis TaxID=2047744 RepID=A0A918A0J1_9ACTN|nr:DUF397 domain-containing protein [Nonomuraea glycinis]MCA2174831.1 DUF397 domain-containing protein [Nonomuraea glycinis]GGP01573.1 hypothetical protein GCM10012278_05350 [Nonomuraea glycinis]
MDLSKAQWRKSTFSGDNGGNCVEVAELTSRLEGARPGHDDTLIAVRDSKDPDGPKLFFTPAEWDAFLNGVKANEFDRS